MTKYYVSIIVDQYFNNIQNSAVINSQKNGFKLRSILFYQPIGQQCDPLVSLVKLIVSLIECRFSGLAI